MRNLFLFLLLFPFAVALSKEPPRILAGFDYSAELAVTEDGVPFVYYVVEGDDFRAFVKSVRSARIVGINIDKNGLMWVDKKTEECSISIAYGIGFRQALVVVDNAG